MQQKCNEHNHCEASGVECLFLRTVPPSWVHTHTTQQHHKAQPQNIGTLSTSQNRTYYQTELCLWVDMVWKRVWLGYETAFVPCYLHWTFDKNQVSQNHSIWTWYRGRELTDNRSINLQLDNLWKIIYMFYEVQNARHFLFKRLIWSFSLFYKTANVISLGCSWCSNKTSYLTEFPWALAKCDFKCVAIITIRGKKYQIKLQHNKNEDTIYYVNK